MLPLLRPLVTLTSFLTLWTNENPPHTQPANQNLELAQRGDVIGSSLIPTNQEAGFFPPFYQSLNFEDEKNTQGSPTGSRKRVQFTHLHVTSRKARFKSAPRHSQLPAVDEC
ncbi:hypothetical protein Pcinc_001745 [Petrolisthes cinctipes]|uniref:Uncharacterized protein n=1 Tax=Petrolisthes cinctipes TaxID=88211 RepID=A0AAE1L2V2_PETCI|nr:hypothetical protein Pcinc_001745 [Petrolisthes cinctipes]